MKVITKTINNPPNKVFSEKSMSEKTFIKVPTNPVNKQIAIIIDKITFIFFSFNTAQLVTSGIVNKAVIKFCSSIERYGTALLNHTASR